MNAYTKETEKVNLNKQTNLKIDNTYKASKTIFDVFMDLVLKQIKKETKSATVTLPVKKAARPRVICLDSYGNFVKCQQGEENKLFTDEGYEFSGIIKQIGSNGEKIDTKYKEGYKLKKCIGEKTVKVYTGKCTKTIRKDSGTIAELKITDSLTNENCKSMVYYDPEIKFAYIDFDSEKAVKFKGLEIRYDGMISGIKRNQGEWKTYFIENGQETASSEANKAQLFEHIKQIMDECKDNSLLTQNNQVYKIEKQIYDIYNDMKQNA